MTRYAISNAANSFAIVLNMCFPPADELSFHVPILYAVIHYVLFFTKLSRKDEVFQLCICGIEMIRAIAPDRC